MLVAIHHWLLRRNRLGDSRTYIPVHAAGTGSVSRHRPCGVPNRVALVEEAAFYGDGRGLCACREPAACRIEAQLNYAPSCRLR
jgi:hypothetical protein